jgi:hypothetical protein
MDTTTTNLSHHRRPGLVHAHHRRHDLRALRAGRHRGAGRRAGRGRPVGRGGQCADHRARRVDRGPGRQRAGRGRVRGQGERGVGGSRCSSGPRRFVLRRREEGCRAGRVLRLRTACVAASNVDNEEVITHEEARFDEQWTGGHRPERGDRERRSAHISGGCGQRGVLRVRRGGWAGGRAGWHRPRGARGRSGCGHQGREPEAPQADRGTGARHRSR